MSQSHAQSHAHSQAHAHPQEVQVDRLVSLTHHYGGLSFGNIASMESAQQVSNPLAALLEGLDKMRIVAEQGIPQLILPPQLRPDLDFLRRIGYQGQNQAVIEAAAHDNPLLLRAAFSSSAMWMANSATVAPSCDTADGAVHLTPANLLHYPHRSLEVDSTQRDFNVLFPAQHGFIHHAPLPSSNAFSDEGAANHTLLTSKHGTKGLHLFVFGRSFYGESGAHGNNRDSDTGRFPARQTKEASMAIARLHQLDPDDVLYWQQSQEAIHAGVFHNDVISVGDESLFIYHEQAFVDTPACIKQLHEKAARRGIPLQCIPIYANELSLEEAVRSYLFNAQIVRAPDGGRLFLVSEEAMEMKKSRLVLDRLSQKIFDLKSIRSIPLRQSMRNGGGPACLRLRIVLTESERAGVHPYAWWTPERHEALVAWGKRYYRTKLDVHDLLDPQLREEARQAEREIYALLQWHKQIE